MSMREGISHLCCGKSRNSGFIRTLRDNKECYQHCFCIFVLTSYNRPADMASKSDPGSIANIRETLQRVRKLANEHLEQNTEKELCKIKYEVIEMLKELLPELTSILNLLQEKDFDVLAVLASVHFNLGIVYVDTNQLKEGEKHLMEFMDLLKGNELKPEVIILVLISLNQLGRIWCRWNQPTKAKSFLAQAEKMYTDFTKFDNSDVDFTKIVYCIDIEEINNMTKFKGTLTNLHTLTLHYLAQVFNLLEDHFHSAIYCHMTLRNQLLLNDITKDMDYIDWALNSATLSQYFMQNNALSQAKHHLAAASYILQKYEDILKQKAESEALTAEWETFNHRKADVARCWAKYEIFLLFISKQRLLNDELELFKEDGSKNSLHKAFVHLKFDTLEKEIAEIANRATDKYILDFDDARPIFLSIQKWLEEAKTYYTLENHASDYVTIIQDLSNAYEQLSFFEEHDDRKAKIHKKRINILEGVLKELNPQYYKSACRKLWVEIGETYSDILDIKFDRALAMSESPSPQLLQKISKLAKKGINNYQTFLNSLEVQNSDSTIKEFPEHLVQPALISYFRIGKLYNKIMISDKNIQLENSEKSIAAYKFIIDYYQKYPKAAEVTNVELSICEEMVSLLTMKISKLRAMENR